MKSKKKECLICGVPKTVKSHLFPASLMHDLRAEAKHLVEGSRFQDGTMFRQSGEWDDGILCDAHEKEVGAGDDYAIKLLRRFRRKEYTPTPDGGYLLVNPDPAKLTLFAYSTIWRFAVARGHENLRADLGPYLKRIEDIVFHGAPHNLDLLFWKRSFHLSDGRETPMAIGPHRQRFAERNCYMFLILGAEFIVKADNQPFPSAMRPYLANGNANLIFAQDTSMPLTEARLVHPILKRMMGTKR
jgi:hypothetical protein